MSPITIQNNEYRRPVISQAHATMIHHATPRLLSTGMFTPANSLADQVRGQTPGGRPINGAKHAMGRLGLAAHGSPGTHTPGNTPNSVEALGRRIHNHLGFGSLSNHNSLAADIPTNRIVPSYEREFTAGLGGLEQRLAQAEPTDRRHFPSTPPTPPNFGASPAFPRGGQSLIGGTSIDRARSSLAFPASFADMPKLDFTKEAVIVEPTMPVKKTKVVPVVDEKRGKKNEVPSPKMDASADSDLLF